MSNYTDGQAIKFYAALEGFNPPGEQQLAAHRGRKWLAAHWGRKWLDSLSAEGITVNFLEPRFYVEAAKLSNDTSWLVKDRRCNGYIAKFCAPDGQANEKRARDLAARLNREDTP